MHSNFAFMFRRLDATINSFTKFGKLPCFTHVRYVRGSIFLSAAGRTKKLVSGLIQSDYWLCVEEFPDSTGNYKNRPSFFQLSHDFGEIFAKLLLLSSNHLAHRFYSYEETNFRLKLTGLIHPPWSVFLGMTKRLKEKYDISVGFDIFLYSLTPWLLRLV